MRELEFRQIHLDFHTSPFINDVGSEFNPEEFVEILKSAGVNSINIFGKCHHGMSYYPTKLGKMHPSLKFDLLGEMLKVLHREGIKAPIYFPVGWEEVSAENMNWLEVSKDGVIGGIKTFEDSNYKWRKICLNKEDYLKFVLAQTQEIIDMYEVDGLWYDIIFQRQCVCADCIKSMKKLGFNPQNDEDVKKHDLIVLKKFMKTVYEYIKERLPEALVFFNGNWAIDGGYDPQYNVMERGQYQTHIEIESLPSELWGYNHFPLYVNYHNKDNAELVGMNGKFHNAWGDFGSLRNEEALEYECFRMIMNGSKCCIGDQLHPRGKLDKAVYERIGRVYKEIEEREPWCRTSQKISEIGVIVSRDALENDFSSDEGVMRMLLELHYCFDFVDCQADFSRYKLLILPDRVSCDEKLSQKLSAYVEQGGKVVATYHSGLNREKRTFNFKEAGVEYIGENESCPSYIILGDEIAGNIAPMEYAMYERGAVVKEGEAAKVLAELGKPYFNRTYDRFCSHRHFPFEKLTGVPAIVENENVIYIANPLFTDYINLGVRVYRDILANCIERLLDKPLVKAELPYSAEVTLRKQGDRTILHILHYIAERKARKLDIVDTKIPLYNCRVSIKADKAPEKVYTAPGMQQLDFVYEKGYVVTTVPKIDGHTMVVLE
jgi:hypothetical protein